MSSIEYKFRHNMSRKILIILSLIVVLIIAYNLISQTMQALKSGERLTEAAVELQSLENKNKELKKNLEYINTQEFIEKQARDKLGLAKKGETVVIIPDEKINQVLGASKNPKLERLPNWQGWLRLFLP